MSPEERAELAEEFEASRASGLRIADATRRFEIACSSLDWALWATDRASHEEGVKFNHVYAAAQLERVAPEWRAARDDLRTVLEAEAGSVR